jgi:hypothetical protein
VGNGMTGFTAASALPVSVQNLPAGTIRDLKAAGGYACAAIDDAMHCWGRTDYSATPLVSNSIAAPVELPGAGTLRQIEVLANHEAVICVLRGDAPSADVVCLTSSGPKPSASFASGNLRAFSAGDDFVCAIVDGGVQCHGMNDDKQLGNAAAGASSATAVDVDGLGPDDPVNVVALASKQSRTCALTDDGDIWCWGYGLAVGLVFPHQTGDIATQLNGHGASLCYVRVREGVEGLWCDGDNRTGQLGSPFTTLNRDTPTKFLQIDAAGMYLKPPFKRFDTGGIGDTAFICAEDQEGLKCWGSNMWRQLGFGPAFSRTEKTPVLSWAP